MRNRILAIICLLSLSGCAQTGSDIMTTEITAEECTTTAPATEEQTTAKHTTSEPTTVASTTVASTTEEPTTIAPTTEEPTTVALTTEEPTTEEPTTEYIKEPSEYGWGYVPPVNENISDLKDFFTKDTFPRINGSTATVPLSEAIFSYTTGLDADEAKKNIIHYKTSESYKALIENKSDILVVYEPSEEIIELLKDHPVYMKPIGIDALVFMENANNPVNSLTSEQLRQIYAGDIKNWSEVGGTANDLIAFQRPASSGSQTLLEKYIMQGTPMSDAPNTVEYDTMEGIINGMLEYNGSDNTLGYSVYYYANSMLSYPELKFVAVDGVLPSSETIYTGEYKLRNPFYAVIRADEPKDSNAHKLFDWLTTDTAQQLIIDKGYVPAIMPENASFPETPVRDFENAEFFDTTPFEEGHYFVFYAGFYDFSGDIVVFDHNWKPIMTFYNANPLKIDIIKTQFLPMYQYRMQPDGSFQKYCCIFDLKNMEYTYLSSNKEINFLDTSRDLYRISECITDIENPTYHTQIIDANGNVILDFQDNIVDAYPTTSGTYIFYSYNHETNEATTIEYDASFNELRPITPKDRQSIHIDTIHRYNLMEEYEEDESIRIVQKYDETYELYINNELIDSGEEIYIYYLNDKKSVITITPKTTKKPAGVTNDFIVYFVNDGKILKKINDMDSFLTTEDHVICSVNKYLYVYNFSGELVLRIKMKW